MALNSRRALVAPVSRTQRVARRPEHPFQLRTRPWQVQPFFIAPVLPGETMQSLTWQARAVTDPIANPLIGWWNEYYFFYVKIRDLDDRATLMNMFLDPNWDDSSVDDTSRKAYHYHIGSGMNWVDLCLKRVMHPDCAYFRDTGETWDEATLESLPLASVAGTSWMDSLQEPGDITAQDVSITVGVDDVVTTSEIQTAMRTWALLQENGLTEMTYEDFLATYGITVPKEERHVPELVRFVRQWSYPANTINPTNGTPSSAVSWVVNERADKARFFSEPGFLFGVTICRPKVYFGRQFGSVLSTFNHMLPWLPAVLSDDPRSSLVTLPDNGILGNVTDSGGTVFDAKDLYLYGEQFLNFSPSGVTNGSFVSLPTVDLLRKYADGTMANNLFVDNDASEGLNKIRQDGIVRLTISGRQRDTSVTNVIA